MSISLGELAAMVGGEVHGDPQLRITGAATLRDGRPGDITLAADARMARQLATSTAAAALVPSGLTIERIPYVTVDQVHHAFSKIIAHFRPVRDQRGCGVSTAAHVSPTAQIGPNVVIHPMATVGDEVRIGARTIIYPGVHLLAGTQIGEDTTIFPNAVLYENTRVGNRVLIHAGAVLGAYGFGYEHVDGRHVRAGQLGYVEIEDDVEIGAGTTIDRGTYGPTLVRMGTKIDNQVQIGHNCSLGRHNILCAQVGIAGSCNTGDYVVMGGQVGIADHVTIGAQVSIAAKTGVKDELLPGVAYYGTPARPYREAMASVAAITKLPEMRKELKRLERRVAELAEGLNETRKGAA